jgi:hypothetical protein
MATDIALRIRAIREQGRCHSLEFRWATDTDMKEGRQEVTNDCDEERSVDAIDDAVDDDGGQSQRLLGNERREPRKAYVTLGRLGYLGIRGPIAIETDLLAPACLKLLGKMTSLDRRIAKILRSNDVILPKSLEGANWKFQGGIRRSFPVAVSAGITPATARSQLRDQKLE